MDPATFILVNSTDYSLDTDLKELNEVFEYNYVDDYDDAHIEIYPEYVPLIFTAVYHFVHPDIIQFLFDNGTHANYTRREYNRGYIDNITRKEIIEETPLFTLFTNLISYKHNLFDTSFKETKILQDRFIEILELLIDNFVDLEHFCHHGQYNILFILFKYTQKTYHKNYHNFDYDFFKKILEILLKNNFDFFGKYSQNTSCSMDYLKTYVFCGLDPRAENSLYPPKKGIFKYSFNKFDRYSDRKTFIVTYSTIFTYFTITKYKLKRFANVLHSLNSLSLDNKPTKCIIQDLFRETCKIWDDNNINIYRSSKFGNSIISVIDKSKFKNMFYQVRYKTALLCLQRKLPNISTKFIYEEILRTYIP